MTPLWAIYDILNPAIGDVIDYDCPTNGNTPVLEHICGPAACAQSPQCYTQVRMSQLGNLRQHTGSFQPILVLMQS